MNIKNTRFIGCFPFPSKVTMLSIINWGELQPDGRIKYDTNFGPQVKTPEEIRAGNFIRVVDIEEIDIERSLHHWFKNTNQHNKPLVYDETLTTGEIYRGNLWHFGLMLSIESERILYNFHFDQD